MTSKSIIDLLPGMAAPAKLFVMIRPFDLRDLALVRRLSEQGSILQAERALTSSPHPLRQALRHMLVGGRPLTYVWRAEDGCAAAFVQVIHKDGEPSAYVGCLGAELVGASSGQAALEEGVWLSLIEQLTKEVGRLGFHNLVAEVSEVGPELPVLRRAGFAVYTRQDIWRCEQLPETGDPGILQPFQTNHEWDIQLLYANNVPRLIQLVEPHPPLENGQSWVLYEDGELVAHVHLNNGEVASWMRLLIHPNANTSTESVIHSALQLAAGSADHPVFLCIRRYQSWIQSSLQQTGFEHWGSQAVLVKHLANPMQKRDSVQLSVLDPQTVPSSSPLVQGFSRSKSAEKQAMPLREQARSFSQGELVPE